MQNSLSASPAPDAIGRGSVDILPGRPPATLDWSVMAAAVVVASIALHAQWWAFVSPDMTQFLLPWYGHILERGPIEAFAAPFANYTPTYLYLLAAGTLLDGWLPALTIIKGISVLGTAFLGIAMWRLLEAASAPKPSASALLVMLLPTPVLNAAFLGQCDALWVACCLLSVAAAIERQHLRMLVWAGLAVSFKAQAVFIAPFVIGLLLRRRVPWSYWLVPPVVFALAMTPAWLAGWPAADLATIYFRQTGIMGTVGNAANPWVLGRVWAPEMAEALVPYGLLLGAVAAAALIWRTCRRHRRVDLLELSLLSALLLPFVLPRMHERYFLLADMLAFTLASSRPTRRHLLLAIMVQGASLLALIAYTQPTPTPVIIGAGLSAVALLMLLFGRRPSVAEMRT